MKARGDSQILTINGGSSSIKFALYAAVKPLKRGLYGTVDRIGLSGTNLTFHEADGKPQASRKLIAADHKSAANSLLDWLETQPDFKSVKAVGHRVVHGMKHTEPEIVTPELLAELHRISPYDPDHLPREIELIERFASVIRNCRSWRALTRRFTKPCRAWPSCCRFRAASMPREFNATVSTVCPMPI
jgi:acetate kinase